MSHLVPHRKWFYFLFNLFIIFYFSITAYIQYYSVLVSDTAKWLENHVLYRVVPQLLEVPTWPHVYVFILIILTILLPMLYFIFLQLFCNYQFALLNPFTFFTQPPKPLPPTAVSLLSVSINLFLSWLFILSIKFHIKVKLCGI